MKLTEEKLVKAMKSGLGLNQKQAIHLGLVKKSLRELRKGWKNRAIGMEISPRDYDILLKLKSKGVEKIPIKKNKLKEKKINNFERKIFKKKEGDTYYEIKEGHYYNVIRWISEDSGYGFAQKVAQSVLKHKKCSEKQAEILIKAIHAG